MRTIFLLLCCLCVVPPVLRAEESKDITVLVPKDSVLCLRLPSLDRAEQVRKEIGPILDAMGVEVGENALPLRLFGEYGIDPTWVDTSKPFYFALARGDEPYGIFHPAEGAVLEGVQDLNKGLKATMRGGFLVVTDAESLAVETRALPTTFLGGDISLHVYLGDLVDAHKNDIEMGFQQAAQMAAFAPNVPPAMLALLDPILDLARGATYGVSSFDYALTWKDGALLSEGYLATREGSGLRTLLTRAGEGAEGNPLIGYMPDDAFVTMDMARNPDWPTKEMAALLEKTFGEGIGDAVQQLFGMGPLAEAMTGRAASATKMAGMMGGATYGLYELKEGTDIATLFDGWDMTAANKAMANLQIPVKLAIEKNVAQYGETALHRMSIQSDDPNLAMMFMMMQTYFAAEGRHLFTVMSPTAETDIQEFIERVRAGTPSETAHMKAMQRLGGKRNVGMTFNLGALKPMGMMFAMASPELGQVFANMPDKMYMSTALSVTRTGELRWRGDWPVKEISAMVAAIREVEKKQDEAAPPPDEDFD